MKLWILIFLLPSIPTLAATPAQCGDVDSERLQKEIGRINQRYDDFFRERREREEREERVQKGAGQVKIDQEIRAKEMERARQTYRAIPKDHSKEEALRVQWEAEQKERLKKIELARLCEVQQRAKTDEILRKGRAIPDLKEFDLDQ
jgi:hypothetical protein